MERNLYRLFLIVAALNGLFSTTPCPICYGCKASTSCGFYLQENSASSLAECVVKCQQIQGCRLIEFISSFPQCKYYDCSSMDNAGSEYQAQFYPCSSVKCGNPPTPLHGSVSAPGGTSIGSAATQSCNVGYDRIGSGTITCEPNAKWSTSATCAIKDCGAPPFPADGTVSLINDKTTYGESANQSCAQGYDISGSGIIQCQSNGLWSTSFTCSITDCGIPVLEHGTVILTNPGITTYGARANVSCDEGYYLSGSDTIECLASGTWNLVFNCTMKAAETSSLQTKITQSSTILGLTALTSNAVTARFSSSRETKSQSFVTAVIATSSNLTVTDKASETSHTVTLQASTDVEKTSLESTIFIPRSTLTESYSTKLRRIKIISADTSNVRNTTIRQFLSERFATSLPTLNISGTSLIFQGKTSSTQRHISRAKCSATKLETAEGIIHMFVLLLWAF